MEINEQSHGKATRKKFLVFSLNGIRYGLPLAKVKEVLGLTPITPLPHVPSYYKGMINLRGQIISIVDLRIKFGSLAIADDPKKTSIIISHVGEAVIGTLVDEVLEVHSYDLNDIDKTEANRTDRSLDGVYAAAKDSNGNLTLLIDLVETLSKTEFKIGLTANQSVHTQKG